MSLIQFSSVATGPFILFRETAERIFKSINEPFRDEGAFAAEDLPDVLARLDAAAAEDKAKAAALEAERERRLREGTYDDEIRAREADREDAVRLYQRIVPLQEMIRRAIRHDKPVMWTKLGR